MRISKPMRKLGSVASIACLLAVPVMAQATNGYYAHGYGAKQNAIAGSGVALPQDAMIGAINPAGLAFVGKDRLIGVSVFSPLRSYTVTGNSPFPPAGFPPFAGPEVDSDSEYFVIPNLGFNWPLSPDSAVGLTIYGNGGMNTDYPAGSTPFGVGTFGAGGVPGAIATTGVDYSQLFVNLGYARKFADGRAAWGVSGIINYSMLELEGIASFAPFSLSPARLSDNGKDTDVGFGLRVGIIGDVTDTISLGASYQTEIKNTLDDYAGVFANGGELDIPATAQIGMAIKANKQLTFTADVQHIWYSDVDAVGNTSQTLTTQCMPSIPFTASPVAAGPGCLGATPGFGWEDMTVLKLGVVYDAGNGWTWRGGVSFGDQPIPDNEVTFNIIAPGVVEQHYTLGFSKKLKNNREISAAFMYAPEKCVSGPDLFTPGKNVELCMHQWQISGEYNF